MCVSIYTNKCNMQHLNNGFNEFKMDDSTHVTTLIVQKMWKNSLNHSNIIAKHWTTCVSI
jgi:glycine/serine hydroxymethyltransferase